MLGSERLWILLLALTAFLAGGAGGLLVGRRMAPSPQVGPFADFEARFADTFSLNEEERRDLHYILDRYHAEVESAEADLVVLLEGKLEQIGMKCRERIRTWVLSPDEREVFDRLVAAAPSPSN